MENKEQEKYCIIREIDLKEIADIITSNQVAWLNRDIDRPKQNMLSLIQDKDLYGRIHKFIAKHYKDLLWMDAHNKICFLNSLENSISKWNQRPDAYICEDDLLYLMLYDNNERMDFHRFYIKR